MGLQEQALWMQTAGTVIAVRHGSLRRTNIISCHTQNLPIRKRSSWQEKCADASIGQGMMIVWMFHNSMWHDTTLKNVLYVPDVSAHLFSVKAATQNGYSTIMNEQEAVIRRGDGTVAASGKPVNNLCILVIRVCIPRHAAKVHLATQAETLQVWHERLGHQNKRHVMKVLKRHGINVEANKEFFDGCALGKARRQSFGTLTSRPSIFGEQINADACGTMTETSVGGVRYYVCFKDDYSKILHVFFINTKSEVADCLQKFLKEVKTAEHVTKVLLSDGGKEFNCEAVQKVLEEHGIKHQLTMPYTPETKGAAEQVTSTIVESARYMLHASGLPEKCGLKPVILQYTYSTYWTHTSGRYDAFVNVDWILCNSWSPVCFWGRMLYAHSQTQKAQVGPKE